MLLRILFLVSASFLIPGTSEVVQSFHKCPDFFLDKKLPDEVLTPFDPARICQTYKNEYRFATMYDIKNFIPIYSAYIYNPKKGDGGESWMIEPQLANRSYSRNMEVEEESSIPAPEIFASQATSSDYEGAPLSVLQGQLNPTVHQSDEDSKAATFSLTNVAPLCNNLLQGAWAKYESKTMKHKNHQFGCSKIYVVTGVVPGKDTLVEGRVNYPSHIWSAACCVLENHARKSWGAVADNDWDIREPTVVELTLGELEQKLAELYNKTKIDLFHSSCY